MKNIIPLVFAAMFTITATATIARAEKPIDLTGTWDITRGGPEDKFAGFTLKLQQDGEKLTGSVTWSDGKTTEIADGVFKEGQMSFKTRPNSVTHAYGGKVEADKIKGKWAAGIAVFDWEARRRVAESLGGPQREAAEKLLKTVEESEDEKTRGAALHELRRLGRRAEITGGRREKHGEIEPQVTGLVPHLIRAATRDQSADNRIFALYALADTLEPAAVAGLRQCLRDENERVRFQASCLLTEFQDASGMAELKAGMKRIQAKPHDSIGMFDLDRLVASFERITGKSFGDLPHNPILASDSRVVEQATNRRTEILNAWAAWWEWKPK